MWVSLNVDAGTKNTLVLSHPPHTYALFFDAGGFWVHSSWFSGNLAQLSPGVTAPIQRCPLVCWEGFCFAPLQLNYRAMA